MLDDFNCPAIDQRGESGEYFFLLKSTIFCFVYIELQIIFAAPTDHFVHLITTHRFIRVGDKP